MYFWRGRVFNENAETNVSFDNLITAISSRIFNRNISCILPHLVLYKKPHEIIRD